MGKKGSWFSSIKKALSPHSKEKKNQKLKKKGLEDEKPSVSITKPASGSHDSPSLPPPEEVKPFKVENELKSHANSVSSEAAATTTQAAATTTTPAAATTTQAAAESTQLTELTRYSGKSTEETASIRIQAAFRGYLARRALRALRGLVRLKTLIEGPTGNRQTATTLRCMQNLSRVQCQINSRRIRMSEENQALQRQLLQKQAKELEISQMGEEWNDSLQSKEQIEAKLLSKYEATMRRERAMAYSFSHQQPWKKSSRTTNLLFMDPTNPQWGWSWLERYMAGRPWETEKNHSSVKNGINITGTEIAKSYARRQLNSTPSTPKSAAGGRVASQKVKRRSNSRTTFGPIPDDDMRSVFSVRSEMNRRHSIAASSVRDDESMDSSLSVPSYMAQTKSAKAKLKGQSMLGAVENGLAEMEFGSKRHLSGSPARPRRHSGPPKVQTSISMVI
ncbi:putative IQ motif, EF-hand binding protein [Helianthus annuus]|nr:putative IQ motif, EF-hand binding protein [Helianthus annuus]